MLRIINYIIRILIVIIGLVFVLGIVKLDNLDTNATKMMGLVFVLFGLYRLSMFYFNEKREQYNSEDDE